MQAVQESMQQASSWQSLWILASKWRRVGTHKVLCRLSFVNHLYSLSPLSLSIYKIIYIILYIYYIILYILYIYNIIIIQKNTQKTPKVPPTYHQGYIILTYHCSLAHVLPRPAAPWRAKLMLLGRSVDTTGWQRVAEDPVEVQSSTSTTAIADCQALQDVQEKIVIVSEAETLSIQHDAT